MKLSAAAVCVVLCCLTLRGQGTVNFANRTASVDARVYDVTGTVPLEGPWTIQLFAGSPGTVVSSLEPVGVPRLLGPSPALGYFSFGEVSVPSIESGQIALLQVRAWLADSPSFEAAMVSDNLFGCSLPFLSQPLGTTGSGGVDLLGLESFGIAPWLGYNVPEAETMDLLAFGLIVLVCTSSVRCGRCRDCSRQV